MELDRSCALGVWGELRILVELVLILPRKEGGRERKDGRENKEKVWREKNRANQTTCHTLTSSQKVCITAHRVRTPSVMGVPGSRNEKQHCARPLARTMVRARTHPGGRSSGPLTTTILPLPVSSCPTGPYTLSLTLETLEGYLDTGEDRTQSD
jgi:hypothetical protein